MIGIINYGAGNLKSVFNALAHAGGSPTVISDPSEADKCSHLVLPGVGSFYSASKVIHDKGWKDKLSSLECSSKPLLGICLGMQLLFDEGCENGISPGLGLISGSVALMPVIDKSKLPHIGWNSIQRAREHILLKGVRDDVDLYFVHSYVCKPSNSEDIILWTTHYNQFVSAVAKKNIVGMQFHPEKSQPAGLKILKNFLSWDGQC